MSQSMDVLTDTEMHILVRLPATLSLLIMARIITLLKALNTFTYTC